MQLNIKPSKYLITYCLILYSLIMGCIVLTLPLGGGIVLASLCCMHGILFAYKHLLLKSKNSICAINWQDDKHTIKWQLHTKGGMQQAQLMPWSFVSPLILILIFKSKEKKTLWQAIILDSNSAKISELKNLRRYLYWHSNSYTYL